MSQQDNIKREEQVNQVITNAGQLISNEVNVAVKEYQLLTDLNLATATRYEHVAQYTQELLNQSKLLAKQQEDFQQEFTQIDQLHAAALGLKNTVRLLEKYMDDVEKQLDSR